MHKTQIDILWIIVASSLVFIMRAGFAMLETGLTRSKNSINVAVKVLTDLGISLAAFWPVGFGLMFGTSYLGLFGLNYFLPDFTDVWLTVFFLFHAMFCSTAATIVSGAVAERIRYSAYIVITFLFSLVIYPVIGHWVWGGSLEGSATGWLAKMGFIDFAGCTVVHSTGGFISLAALLILGPRIGRYNADGSVNRITGSNLQTSVIGAILLWFGWFGFNGGSTLALNDDVPAIIMRTTLAGAAGLVVTLFSGWTMRKYPDVSLVVNGAIAGLVAITAACAYVNAWQSVVIGAIGGLIMLFLEWFLDSRRIDDAVTAIPVHLGAGVWGSLAVGIFGNPDLLKTGLSRTDQILVQLLGIVASGIFAFVVAYIAIWILNKIHPIRVKPEEEAIGLNVVEHKASTELYDLYRTLEEQARTGDLTLRAPVEPFTEVGQIADRYNNLLDSLEKNLVARSEYLNILDNVTDGLFLLSPNWQIGRHYSQALESIIGEHGIAGKNIIEILSQRMPAQNITPVREFLELMFQPATNERTLAQLNPLADVEFRIDLQNGRFETRHVQMFFKRILNEGSIVSLMVIIRDVTEQKQLARQFHETRESQRSEMELLSRVIQIEPTELGEFMEDFLVGIEAINDTLESNSSDYAELLDRIFRSVHLLKGDADTLGLDFITEKADAFESRIIEVRNRNKLAPEDFLPLTIIFKELREIYDRIAALLARVATFQTLSHKNGNLMAFLAPLTRLTERLQERHGKALKLHIAEIVEADLPTEIRAPIREILVQLIRNSVAHGIESPELRKSRGKPAEGHLSVTLERHDTTMTLVYSDDGAGLDLEAIRSHAVSSGRITESSANGMSSKELLGLVFSSGFSTAAQNGMTAGRGVGLDAIRDLVRKLGGRISIRTRPGVLCEFRIFLPLTERRIAQETSMLATSVH